jgi:hypothetical protein
MRLLLLFFSLFLITGCGQIKQMNSNMETSNENLTKNTATVQHSSDIIQKNTEEVSRSTDNMRIIAIVLPIIVIILLYPCYLLVKQQRKLLHDMKLLIDRFKKN